MSSTVQMTTVVIVRAAWWSVEVLTKHGTRDADSGEWGIMRTLLSPVHLSHGGVSSVQGVEVELRSVQSYSLHSEGYLVQLDDRLSSLSSSATRNLTGLGAEVARASTWLREHDILLRYAQDTDEDARF